MCYIYAMGVAGIFKMCIVYIVPLAKLVKLIKLILSLDFSRYALS
jgi:hypothetical protein